MKHLILYALLFCLGTCWGQDTPVVLYRQFNGPFDFTCFGNTLNTGENNLQIPDICAIETQSSASFSLNAGSTVEKAYLYWAGSGTGDLNVKLNGVDLQPDRVLSLVMGSSGLPFFSAFKEVTNLVQTIGPGVYTLSDFDLTALIPDYCGNATNFGGWAVVVIYRDNSLPINQVNIYDGLQGVPSTLQIQLDYLNVVDAVGAKIGFVAWEGDASLAVSETLTINNNPLSSLPLNPVNNAFNGTNSYTGANNMYNMDLDFYDIQNNIQPGDTTASIALTSGQDFVMVNVILTKLNTLLAEITSSIATVQPKCGRQFDVTYQLKNTLGIAAVPANIPVAFYAGNQLLTVVLNNTIIPPGGSFTGSVTVTIPANITVPFELKIVADDTGTGTGVVSESNEDNNSFELSVNEMWDNPSNINPTGLVACLQPNGSVQFDLNLLISQLILQTGDQVRFYGSLSDAQNGNQVINTSTPYVVSNFPANVYILIVSNKGCTSIVSAPLLANNCMPQLALQNITTACDSQIAKVTVTITNPYTNLTLVAGIPVSVYLNGVYVETINSVPILNPLQSFTLGFSVTVPIGSPNPNLVEVIAGQNAFGTLPNTTPVSISFDINLRKTPATNPLADLKVCNLGLGKGVFDWSLYENQVKVQPADQVQFYASQSDADAIQNPISNIQNYQANHTPLPIIARVDNGSGCPAFQGFQLTTYNCPPEIFNYLSINGDGANERFYIKGLKDVFLNHELKIYNRWGVLLFTGNNQTPEWTGVPNEGQLIAQVPVPDGTYFYVLQLNDPDFPQPYTGYLYVTHR
ncbi:MAG: hypothetical protein CFE24_13610 [Flavobacterium sp. BFFFF2]|nr:MAG: hypothetical protein CFE24_13610 [Flavobacterium sp. BFFFF2]